MSDLFFCQTIADTVSAFRKPLSSLSGGNERRRLRPPALQQGFRSCLSILAGEGCCSHLYPAALTKTRIPGILPQALCSSRHFPAPSLPPPKQSEANHRPARSLCSGRGRAARPGSRSRAASSGLRATRPPRRPAAGEGGAFAPRQKMPALCCPPAVPWILPAAPSAPPSGAAETTPAALPSSSPRPGSAPLPSPCDPLSNPGRAQSRRAQPAGRGAAWRWEPPAGHGVGSSGVVPPPPSPPPAARPPSQRTYPISVSISASAPSSASIPAPLTPAGCANAATCRSRAPRRPIGARGPRPANGGPGGLQPPTGHHTAPPRPGHTAPSPPHPTPPRRALGDPRDAGLGG